MRNLALLALSALALAGSAPAFAQDAMMKKDGQTGAMHHMSAADTRMMDKCKAKPDNRMMRDKSCARMMRTHSGSMQHDNMMKHGSMMKQDNMMKHDSMTPGH